LPHLKGEVRDDVEEEVEVEVKGGRDGGGGRWRYRM